MRIGRSLGLQRLLGEDCAHPVEKHPQSARDGSVAGMYRVEWRRLGAEITQHFDQSAGCEVGGEPVLRRLDEAEALFRTRRRRVGIVTGDDAGATPIVQRATAGEFQRHHIARVVRFLAGAQAAWISGQVIRANGGVI